MKSKRFFSLLVAILLIPIGVQSALAENGAGNDGTMVFTTLAEDTANFYNPEKGWYEPRETNDMYGISQLRGGFVSTVLLEADLGAFRNGPISSAKLTEIRNAFTTLKNNGLSAMFRAAYTFDEVYSPEPNSFQTILDHIAQLEPIFTDFEDILIAVQAGFLGPWGEWHGSRYSLGSSGNNYDFINIENYGKYVIRALMEAVPASVSIQVRTPYYIRQLHAAKDGDGNGFFSESELARLGFHHDGLFADVDDSGTYLRNDSTRQYVTNDTQRRTELDWVSNNCINRVVVAESNDESGNSKYLDPRIWTTVEELGQLHMQMINRDYSKAVIGNWREWTYNGTTFYDYVQHYLGYNLVLEKVGFNSEIGEYLHFQFDVTNNGFGNLIKEKDFDIILTKGIDSYVAKVNDDPREWRKEEGLITKNLYFSIPQDIEPGIWDVNIRLSSTFLPLKNNPYYCVRLANIGVWQPSTGYNQVGSITVGNMLRSEYTAFEQIEEPEEATIYSISIIQSQNGTVTADKYTAVSGETVSLTVTPDEGYMLQEGSLRYNGMPVADSSFIMPPADVTVSAVFEPLQGNTHSLTGQVRSYNPGNSTSVRLMQGGEEVYATAIPAETGQYDQHTQDFTFFDVAPGEYSLVVTKPAHVSFTVQTVLIGDEDVDLADDIRPEVRLMALPCGDLNGDGMVNSADLAILWSSNNYNKSVAQVAEPLCDLNGDGMVNNADLAILWLAANYNKGPVVVP